MAWVSEWSWVGCSGMGGVIVLTKVRVCKTWLAKSHVEFNKGGGSLALRNGVGVVAGGMGNAVFQDKVELAKALDFFLPITWVWLLLAFLLDRLFKPGIFALLYNLLRLTLIFQHADPSRQYIYKEWPNVAKEKETEKQTKAGAESLTKTYLVEKSKSGDPSLL